MLSPRDVASSPPAGSACLICGGGLSAHFAAEDRFHGLPGPFTVAICGVCRCGQTLPRTDESSLAGYYPETYGPHDVAENRFLALISHVIRSFQGWLARRTQPLRALSVRAPGRAVDVGCGRGDRAAMLAAHGWAMMGIEPSARGCGAARARGLETRQGTLSTVSLQPDVFDAAIFQHSLEHANDPVQDLRRVAAALAPGGLVLITVPNFGGWQARHFGERWLHLDVPRHRVHFTRDGLQRAIRQAGLELVSLSSSTSTVGLPASLQYVLFGRCLFPAGLGLRIASGLTVALLPVAIALDRLTGDGDLLHAVARRSLSG